ncbi:MAG: hypothetical protein HQL09_00120 [Nitrospirae bacterium]|nr:hypothetical protein [Nitrospirota bacterium]
MTQPDRQNALPLSKELKEKFKREFTPSEKLFFLKRAEEAIAVKGYPADEDLFHYCFFLTMKERLSGIRLQSSEGYARFFLVEAKRDTEEEINIYKERLESKKRDIPDMMGYKFIEFFAD